MTGEAARPAIPDKLYFRIGEVSELTGVQPYTLRHWEMEFPTLSPKKNDAGQRLYRREDIEMVQEIQRLLHRDGYTTAGARRLLSEKRREARKGRQRRAGSQSPAPSPSLRNPAVPARPSPEASRNPAPMPDAAPAVPRLSSEDRRRLREALDLMEENDRTLARLLDDRPD